MSTSFQLKARFFERLDQGGGVFMGVKLAMSCRVEPEGRYRRLLVDRRKVTTVSEVVVNGPKNLRYRVHRAWPVGRFLSSRWLAAWRHRFRIRSTSRDACLSVSSTTGTRLRFCESEPMFLRSLAVATYDLITFAGSTTRSTRPPSRSRASARQPSA